MIAEHRTIDFNTRGNDHILDLTDRVQVLVAEVGVTIGQIVLLALPVVDGAVPLGTWQQIVFMDFDTRPRRRTVHMSVVGV